MLVGESVRGISGMMRKYSIQASYEPPDTDEAEIELRIWFTFTPGSPDTYDASRGGPGGWDQGYGPEIEFDSVERETAGQWIAAPELEEWAAEYLRTKGYDRAVEEAEEENQPDPDDARDQDRDDKLMGVGRYAPMDDEGC
jgi:hypothetical protein